MGTRRKIQEPHHTTDATAKNPLLRMADSYVNSEALEANTPKTVTIPEWATHAVINSGGVDFYMGVNAVAAFPTGDILNGTAPRRGLIAFPMTGVNSLSLIAAEACHIEIEWCGEEG